MNIVTVSKSQFKPKAFKYLRMVENHQSEICITDHGKSVVRLIPYTQDDEKILVEMRNLVTHYEYLLEPITDSE